MMATRVAGVPSQDESQDELSSTLLDTAAYSRPLPRLAARTRTLTSESPRRATVSAVPSTLPSSTTRTSNGSPRAVMYASTRSSVCPIRAASLYAGMTTDRR